MNTNKRTIADLGVIAISVGTAILTGLGVFVGGEKFVSKALPNADEIVKLSK